MDQSKGQPRDLAERLFAFSLRIVRLATRLYELGGVARTLSYSILKSGTVIGAYYEEAQAGGERPEFIRKASMALQEARQTHYWLRLLVGAEILAPGTLTDLVDESDQIAKILGSIVYRSRQNLE
jgi:four helix bundle protein